MSDKKALLEATMAGLEALHVVRRQRTLRTSVRSPEAQEAVRKRVLDMDLAPDEMRRSVPRRGRSRGLNKPLGSSGFDPETWT